jgi:hypothetical protein
VKASRSRNATNEIKFVRQTTEHKIERLQRGEMLDEMKNDSAVARYLGCNKNGQNA